MKDLRTEIVRLHVFYILYYLLLISNMCVCVVCGLPWWLRVKESACNAGALCSIPESVRSPGEENGNPLQYSCLENPMVRGA